MILFLKQLQYVVYEPAILDFLKILTPINVAVLIFISEMGIPSPKQISTINTEVDVSNFNAELRKE